MSPVNVLRFLSVLIFGLTLAACKTRTSTTRLQTAEVTNKNCDNSIDYKENCYISLSDLMLATVDPLDTTELSQEVADSIVSISPMQTEGLSLAGPQVRPRPRLQARVVQRMEADLHNAPAHERLELNNEHTQVKMRLKLQESNGFNKIFSGILESGGKKYGVFFKPRVWGDSGGWNNPNAEGIANEIHSAMGGETSLSFSRPKVFYLGNKGRSYGHFQGQDIWEGVAIVHAKIDGYAMTSIPTLMTRDGKMKKKINVPTAGGHRDIEVPEAMQKKVLESVQYDQILRYVLGDPDGHMNQYMVRYKLKDDNTLDDIDILSLDYGAMGVLATQPGVHLAGSQPDRMRMLENMRTNISADAGGDWHIDLPKKLDPRFKENIQALRSIVEAYNLVDPPGHQINTTWRQQVNARIDRLMEAYP